MEKFANRQVCDVDIRLLKTGKPFLFFDTANTTTTGISADNVNAMAKGAKRVTFQNPLDGTLTIEAQVIPFEVFAMYSDGVIESSATYTTHKTVEATQAGKLTIEGAKAPVFVYKEDEYGKTEIAGTLSEGVFTATQAADIAVGSKYEVGCIVSKESGIKKVSLNNKKLPKDFKITMQTYNKTEDDEIIPFVIVAYKASIERNIEMGFSSEGDPVSFSIQFSLNEDKEGNFVDLIELTDEAE